MSDESEFIAAARRFGVQFKGLLHAADIMEDIEKHKTAAREAEQRLEALRGKLLDAEADIENAHRTADEKIKGKLFAADQEIAEKHRKADEIIDQAHEKAGRVLSAARDEAAGFAQQVEAHKTAIAGYKTEIAGLVAEICTHEDFRDQAKAGAAEAKRQHEGEVAWLRSFRASLPPVE